jgi:hypothetical protein
LHYFIFYILSHSPFSHTFMFFIFFHIQHAFIFFWFHFLINVYMIVCFVHFVLICKLCIFIMFMYSYCNVYVFLWLCTFYSVYSVSLCCSVYCLCVNVYCTVPLPPGVNPTAVNKYININIQKSLWSNQISLPHRSVLRYLFGILLYSIHLINPLDPTCWNYFYFWINLSIRSFVCLSRPVRNNLKPWFLNVISTACYFIQIQFVQLFGTWTDNNIYKN